MKLLALDAHAHLVPSVSSVQLDELRSYVVAVTRSAAEFRQVLNRRDHSTVWALGSHPGLVKVQRDFSATEFDELIPFASVIGEVGLDGNSKVPMERQRHVLRSILTALRKSPRVITVHSYCATSEVIEELRTTPANAVILHWWLGDVHQTKEALALGCYFSINAAGARKKDLFRFVPLDRILTETDHPFGDRWSRPPRRPGAVEDVEKALANHYSISPQAIRETVWRNFSEVLSRSESAALLPRGFRIQLESANNGNEKVPRLFQ